MFGFGRSFYSCSKHNYTGINNPCPDCQKEISEEVLQARAEVQHFLKAYSNLQYNLSLHPSRLAPNTKKALDVTDEAYIRVLRRFS